MKNLKTALAVLLLSGLALPASAGFSGPSKNNAATVAEAKEMPDESYVVLHGYIESSLGSEEYMFKDDSGSIKIEIDDDDWNGLTVGPDDKVEIQGEVDTHMVKPTDIEVDIIRLVK